MAETAAGAHGGGGHGGGEGEDRRDFLKILTGAVGAVGAGAVVWAFGAYLGPDARAERDGSYEIDLASIGKNSGRVVRWRGRPVFIRHLTQKQVNAVEATPLKALIDPEPVAARVKAGHEQWAVVIGVGPDDGCMPVGTTGGDRGPYDGWVSPCDGSAFDAVGRVRRGPARRNLEVPPYRFVNDTVLRLG